MSAIAQSSPPPPAPADAAVISAPSATGNGAAPPAQAPNTLTQIASPLAMWRTGKQAEAISAAEQILRGPIAGEAHLVLSFAAENSGDLATALGHAREAGQQASPVHVASLLYKLGRFDEAVAAARAAVENFPKSGAALCQLALFMREGGDFAGARDRFQRAVALQPNLVEAHFGLGQVLLLQGEFRSGWDEYEWRFKLPMAKGAIPTLPHPEWNGMRWPEGRIVLIADQGYGDSIQFCRFVPMVAERVGTVVLGCAGLLKPLFEKLPGAAKVIDRLEDLPPVDVQMTLSGLPRLFGADIDTIPAKVPYIVPAPASVERWRERIAALAAPGALKVGLCWAGRPTHPNDAKRSMSLAQFLPLAAVPGVQFFGIQHGPAAAQATDWGTKIIDLSGDFGDFQEAAACVANLDLVITVDTVSIHLAGALGVPGWVLLPAVPDWRWLLDREDTPWYPSVRLFRQGAERRWEPVVARIAEELSAMAAARR